MSSIGSKVQKADTKKKKKTPAIHHVRVYVYDFVSHVIVNEVFYKLFKNYRKTARRSLPGRINHETVTMEMPTPKKLTRTRSGPQKSESYLNSPVSATRKGSQLSVDKKNAKGETPLQVACIKVCSCLFYVVLRIFRPYWDVTIVGEGL
jgi:hypothetical protein